MKEDQSDQSVGIAFSELAWLLLLGVVLLWCYNLVKYNKMIAQKNKQIVKYAKKNEGLKKDITKEKNTLIAEKNKAQNRVKELEEKLKEDKALIAERNKAQNRVKELEEKLKEDKALIAERNRTQNRVKELEEKLKDAVEGEHTVRKELIGLKGNLDRVIFALDCSASMASSGRWEEACDTTETWLQYLSVKECVVITFSDDVEVFGPKEKDQKRLKFLDMSGSAYKKNLNYLKECLKNVEPGGFTNTLAALRKAFEYDKVGMIILFTDGAPTRGPSLGGIFKPQMGFEILELCRERKRIGRNIPINVIGIGDYFDSKLGHFLLQLAEDTEGTFIGK